MSKVALDSGAVFSDGVTASRQDTPKHAPRIRNMTGVYLGTEGSVPQPRTRQGIPPLIRRQTLPPPKTPREQYGRYQKVEVLKAKEEPRGFNPLPIKRAKPKTAKSKEDPDLQSPRTNTLSPDYSQLTKKSTRSFTIIKSNGISNLEYVDNRVKTYKPDDGLADDDALEEIKRVASTSKDLIGIASVYNNVCKINNCDSYDQRNSADGNKTLHHGNSAMLRSLLPQRRVQMGSRSQSIMAPLTVKSFRNPQNPHTVVQYSQIDRPKSTKGYRPPTVPAPYFYDSRKMVRSGDASSGRVKLVELPNSVHGNAKILAAPGVGAISRQASSKHIRRQQSGGIDGQPPPTTTTTTNNGKNNSESNVSEEPFRRPETQETTRIDPPVPTATPTHERGGAISPSASVTDALLKAQDSSMPGASSTSSPVQHRIAKGVYEEHNFDTKSNSSSIKVSVPSVENTQPDSRASTPDQLDIPDQDVLGDSDSSKLSKNVDDDNSSELKEPDGSAKVSAEENKEQLPGATEGGETVNEKTDSSEGEMQGSDVKGEVQGSDVKGESVEKSGIEDVQSKSEEPDSVVDENDPVKGTNSGAVISSGIAPPAMILTAVDDGDGESQPVAIDLDPIETGYTDKEISQNAHTSDEQVAEFIESASRKQTELQQLLEEHSQLVLEIDDMEKNKVSTEGDESDSDDEEE